MEVRPGYKHTELGVIPEKWALELLPNVCWFQEGPGLRQWQFRAKGIKVINVTNLENGFLNLDNTDRYISVEEFERSYKHFLIDSGDIVVASSGNSYCKVAVVRDDDLPLLMNTSVIRFKPSKGLDYGYLLAFLKSSLFKNQIDLLITGGAQPNFGPYHLKRIFIPYAPISEQRAIAAALSDVDALIAALERLIAKKRAIKQGAMQQLLTGQTRLPGFSGEWEVKNLGEMGKCIRGVSYNGESDLHPYDTDDTVRLLRANNVQDATIVSNDLQFVNSRRVADEQILQGDDIVICMSSGSKELVGKTALFNLKDGFRYTFGAFMGCFRINRSLADSSFVSFWLQTQKYKDFISILLSGSSINNLKPGDIESIKVLLPPPQEQRAIAAVLSDMDAEIAALEARRENTRALKQGMMQELLTGKTRLV
jgi:type I restriction enzyme S subunit